MQSRLPEANLVLTGGHRWNPADLFVTPEERAIAREQVILTRDVTDAELAALYSGARAFVFPSLLEGFGLPALEAMQCGTPVIASSTSSLPEVVGDAAVLVDPTDRDALSGAMLALLQDDARCTELGTRAIARASLFSWDETAARVVEAYRDACKL
jgi:glycosyltransferase involved in cell wall biosynthesis